MKLFIFDFNRTLYNPVTQQLHPGAVETLEFSLEQGIINVLLTTGVHSRANAIFELGLCDYFDCIKYVTEKTDEAILKIIQQYHAQLNDVLIIGDDPEGELLSGKKLRIQTVAVGTGYCDQEKAQEMGISYTATIKTLKEFL